MRNRTFFLGLSILLLSTFQAEAATYAVKASGGDFTTISACAAAANAGDTCVVYAGIYSETPTLTKSGTAGNPITFSVNPGDCVQVSGFNLNSVSYITIGTPGSSTCSTTSPTGTYAHSGFYITNSPISFASASNIIIQSNYIYSVGGNCLAGPNTVSAGTATYFYVLNNVLDTCGGPGAGVAGPHAGIGMEGNHWLVSGNTIEHNGAAIYAYGSYLVIRNNSFGPTNLTELGSEHSQPLESTCAGVGIDYPLVHMVYENNITNQWRGPNSHGMLLRDINACGQTQNIIRYNQLLNVGSDFISNDGNSSSNPVAGTQEFIYNNSVSNDQLDASPEYSDLTLAFGNTGAVVINNIFQDNWQETPPYCIYVDGTSISGFVENHNLCYLTGFSGTWQVGSNTNSTTDIFNTNPLFIAETSNLTLQASSPAVQAGGPLTTATSSGTSSTSLAVGNAALFQWGYGLAGVQADWIRVGPSTTVQIASINYSTNVLTLASPISWSSGANVYLYKNSSGVIVLNGANPDLGALPAGSTPASTAPVPPTNVTATVH